MDLSSIKSLVANAKKQKNVWDKEHCQNLLILCIKTFHINTTDIITLIGDLDMFATPIVAELVDKDLISVKCAWKNILNFSITDEKKFIRVCAAAVEYELPIFESSLHEMNIIQQVCSFY